MRGALGRARVRGPHPVAPMPVPHLLLDFGSVVCLSLFEDLGAIERAFALPAGSLDWTGPLERGHDPLWRAMLAGELSERDYWHRRAAELGERVGRPLDVVSMIRAAREHDPDGCVRPEARALIDAARAAGRRVGLLTNELVLFYGEALARRLRVLDAFDTIVDGTWTRILKPDPRAYRMACVALEAAPADVVFIDDQPRNVAGGLACGLQAIHLDVNRPHLAFAEAARRLGLEVPGLQGPAR